MGKKINNSVSPGKKISNTVDLEKLDNHLYKNYNMVIDFSFVGAFVSCKQGSFNNYLQDKEEFIQKFRTMMIDVQNLSQKKPNEIFNGGEYRHCHRAKYEELAVEIIKNIFSKTGKSDANFEQEIGGEIISQIGLQSEVRLFGVIKGNVFRVYFIDYYHDFEFDQRRNERNKKNCKFCAMTTILE